MNPLDDFLAFKKEAGWLSDVASAVGGALKGFGGAAKEQVKGVLPQIVTGVGIGAGITGVGLGVAKIQESFGKQRDFKAMMAANPHLEKMDAGNIQLTYNSLRKAAPSLASDPLMAGSFVRRTLEMSDPPYVDAQTIKTLTDAQKSISQRAGSHPFRDIAMAAAARPISTEKPDYPITASEQGVSRKFGPGQEAEARAWHEAVRPDPMSPPMKMFRSAPRGSSSDVSRVPGTTEKGVFSVR
jgi:hypothetical protein